MKTFVLSLLSILATVTATDTWLCTYEGCYACTDPNIPSPCIYGHYLGFFGATNETECDDICGHKCITDAGPYDGCWPCNLSNTSIVCHDEPCFSQATNPSCAVIYYELGYGTPCVPCFWGDDECVGGYSYFDNKTECEAANVRYYALNGECIECTFSDKCGGYAVGYSEYLTESDCETAINDGMSGYGCTATNGCEACSNTFPYTHGVCNGESEKYSINISRFDTQLQCSSVCGRRCGDYTDIFDVEQHGCLPSVVGETNYTVGQCYGFRDERCNVTAAPTQT